jgi:hypothetical protein
MMNILHNSARSNLYSLTGKTSGLPIYELNLKGAEYLLLLEICKEKGEVKSRP